MQHKAQPSLFISARLFHPQAQGKIERYHRSMKNVIKLKNYYFPEELEHQIAQFIDYHNNHRYHESFQNLTPADVFFGRDQEALVRREAILQQSLQKRSEQNQKRKFALIG